jgi:hypothetical protein
MNGLTALVFATPLFGFQLQPPPADLAPDVVFAAALQDELEEEALEEEGDEALSPEEAAEEAEADAYADQLRERARVVSLHRPLGIATWISMGVTLLLGGFQYHNLYGVFAALEDTPCVQGSAIFGQSACSGTPWPHLVSAGITSALYSATFALSLMMPDPDDSDEGDGEFAQTLRMHKLLRWVHFGGMVAQVLMGAIIANDMFGLDRANDYGTLQLLATLHMGIGIATYGALTWAGALMVL